MDPQLESTIPIPIMDQIISLCLVKEKQCFRLTCKLFKQIVDNIYLPIATKKFNLASHGIINPSSVAVDPHDGCLYVTARSSLYKIVVKEESLQVTEVCIDGAVVVKGLTMDCKNRVLYMVECIRDYIYTYNLTTTVVAKMRFPNSKMTHASFLIVDLPNIVLCTGKNILPDFNAYKLKCINTRYGGHKTFTLPEGMKISASCGLTCISKTQELYFTPKDPSGLLFKINIETDVISFVTKLESNKKAVNILADEDNLCIYILDRLHCLQKVDLKTKKVTILQNAQPSNNIVRGCNVHGFCYHSKKRTFYVTNQHTNQLFVYSNRSTIM